MLYIGTVSDGDRMLAGAYAFVDLETPGCNPVHDLSLIHI